MSIKHSITALIYDKKGKLLSIGTNSYVKTHPIQAKAAKAVGEPCRIFLHAEIAAIVRLKDWTKAHTMVLTRFKKDGSEGLSKPCKACQHVINLTGIHNVYYTGT
jgi:deoxycytidylate deaminase